MFPHGRCTPRTAEPTAIHENPRGHRGTRYGRLSRMTPDRRVGSFFCFFSAGGTGGTRSESSLPALSTSSNRDFKVRTSENRGEEHTPGERGRERKRGGKSPLWGERGMLWESNIESRKQEESRQPCIPRCLSLSLSLSFPNHPCSCSSSSYLRMSFPQGSQRWFGFAF